MPGIDFKSYAVTLGLQRSIRLHFNHGGALHGLLRAAMGGHEMPGVLPFASESGSVRFAAGEPYRFVITLVGAATTSIETLAAGLARTGARREQTGGPQPTFGGNFEVTSIEALADPDLAGEFAAVAAHQSLTLRFLSPLRLERPEELQRPGARHLNQKCFPADHFLRRLWNRWLYWERGRYPSREELRAEPAPDTGAATSHSPALLWIDVPVPGAPGKDTEQPKGITLGGVQGRIALADVPGDWRQLLVLGQYFCAGEKTQYGFGRYEIVEAGGNHREALRPARTFAKRLADAGLLGAALDHLLTRSDAAGIDGIAPDAFALARERLLPELAADLSSGAYHPQRLEGFLGEKAGGKLRPLAIPTVRDRIAQRAAGELLGPGIETLLEDCAYAYRKGFSRSGAARAIQRAYQDGYRYVLDADISAFFDSVEWPRLFAKLEALYPIEPLRTLIEAWVRAPVRFDGRELARSRGLPQGTPISPWLANLFLDEFDEELLGHDYRLVRYADDFVVLTKDLAAAQQAKTDAIAALGHLGLTLSEDKTSIRSMQEGFTYLGYLFCRSLVLETERPVGSEAPVPSVLPLDAIPPASWLAQVPFERVQELALHRPSGVRPSGVRPPQLATVALAGNASPEPEARPLFVSSHETQLILRGETLVANAPGSPAVEFPLRRLSQVVFFGKPRSSLPLVLALQRFAVPVFFCRASGELYAAFNPHTPDWPLWNAQAAAAADEPLRLAFAREVVAAKLHNFATITVRFGFESAEQTAAAIRDLERAAGNKVDADALRGLEGRGAALYFAALGASLPQEWHFEGRRKHPATDPVNALLSFGYTLLHNHLSTALVAAGLNPRIGLFHAEHGAHHALASDLQEEFRHLVDALVWSLIAKKIVKTADFRPALDGDPAVWMTAAFRNRYLGEFEKRLQTTFTPEGAAGAVTYLEFMYRQARAVVDLVRRRTALYSPLRAHA